MNDSIPALSPYIEPASVRFTFDAPGWHAIAALLVLVVLCAMGLWIRHYLRNRYRRIAVSLVRDNKRQALAGNEYDKLVYNANMIAKQICIRLYGRQETASLKDTPWIIFLNKSCPKAGFSTADEQIIRAIYNSHATIEKQQALNFADKITYWIQKHRTRL